MARWGHGAMGPWGASLRAWTQSMVTGVMVNGVTYAYSEATEWEQHGAAVSDLAASPPALPEPPTGG